MGGASATVVSGAPGNGTAMATMPAGVNVNETVFVVRVALPQVEGHAHIPVEGENHQHQRDVTIITRICITLRKGAEDSNHCAKNRLLLVFVPDFIG